MVLVDPEINKLLVHSWLEVRAGRPDDEQGSILFDGSLLLYTAQHLDVGRKHISMPTDKIC